MIPNKILGVYGGLGPAASAEFLRLLAELSPAKRDQEHAIVYMYSNPHTPDRTDALMYGGEDPSECLKKGLDILCDWGADILAVPCNTAHIFIDRFAVDLKRPLVHIVHATINDAVRLSPDGSWLISTEATREFRIYEREAERRGYELFSINNDIQQLVTLSMRLVKARQIRKSGKVMEELVRRLWNIRFAPVVTGCTELPIAYAASSLPAYMNISSLKSLASACVRELYNPKSKTFSD